MEHILKMSCPSSWWHDLWREGLPTGNGFTGANLYGGAKREILQLGRHDFWYRGSEEEVPDVQDAFHRLRRKMDDGNFKEASWEIVNALKEKGYGSSLESHLPVANLITEQMPVKGFRSFSRSLDMERAVAGQQWMDGPFAMHRDVFVSRAEDLVVYRLQAKDTGENSAEAFGKQISSGKQISGKRADRRESSDRELLEYQLALVAYQNEGEQPCEEIRDIWESASMEVVCDDDHTAYLYFHSRREKANVQPGYSEPGKQSCGFGAVAKVSVKQGGLKTFGTKLKVKASDDILVTIALYVDEEREDAWKRIHDRLAAHQESFEQLLDKSAPLHSALYHSAQLKLGRRKEGEVWERTNEDLVMEAFSDRQSTELMEKLWHYGRYLFICGTNPEANPFPLYGLWGGGYQLQWCHNMANENLQMIYWHSLCGNLIDYNRAIFQYMNDRIPAFCRNGRKLFGIDGIYMTAGTTPGVSSPTQVVPVIINWVGAAGWIAQHYYQYFLYTRDMDYARKVMLPYMDGVARFYEEFVQFTKDNDGRERIRFYPSVSPENTPVNFMPPEGVQMAHPMPTTINSTIDLSILKEFFGSMLEISGLWEDAPFSKERIDSWKRILASIPEFQLNSQGAVKEWQEDIFKDRYDHRHLSHIYPVFPGYELYPEKDPEKIGAYEKAVSLRKIDAQTGWSMAHMAAIYARLRKGDAAMECLDNMAKSCLLPNFFTLHNDWRGMNISLTMDPAPVQLDAIMGYVNAVQEMILYAAPGYLALLPALEERLFVGEVRNFRYSDGLLHMKWDVEQKEFFCEITPVRPHKVQIVLPDFVKEIKWSGLENGQTVKLQKNMWELTLGEETVRGEN